MQPPPGALCALHPAVAAVAICERCGAFACEACATWLPTGERRCRACAQPTWSLAPRGTRLLAAVVDNVVVMVPLVAAAVAATALGMFVEEGRPESDDRDALLGLGVLFAVGVGLVLGLGLELLMQVRTGRSVGKWVFGLRVVRKDGTPIDLARLVLLRNLVPAVASQMCSIFGIIDALFIFGAEQRCLHDLMADSIVVLDPRR